MKKLLLISVLFSSNICFTQNNAQAFDWALNPGANSNSLKALHYDSQGNLLVLASASDSASFGGNIITALPSGSFPTTNYYIGKRYANGTSQVVLQSRNGATNVFSNFSDFNVDANNNIIVVGATSAGHDFGNGVTLSNKGYFIAKYNSIGTAQWAKMYNFGNPNMSSFTTKPWHIQCLPNGDIVAVLKETTRFAYIKLDANGNELVYKEYTITNTGSNSTITSSQNNCYIDNTGAFYLYYNTIDMSTTPKLKLSTVTNSVTTPFDSVSVSNTGHAGVSYLLAFRPSGSKKYFKGFRGSMIDFAVEANTGNAFLNWTQYGGQNNIAPMNMINNNAGTFAQTYTGIIAVDSLCNYIKKTNDVLNVTQQIALKSILPIGNFKLIGTQKTYNTGDVLTANTQTYSVSSGGLFVWFELDQNLAPNYFVAAPFYSTTTSPLPPISNYNSKVAVGLSWIATTQTTLNINGTILKANDKNTSFPTRYTAPYNAIGTDIAIAQFDRTLSGSTASINESQNKTINYILYPNPSKNVLNIELDNLLNDDKTVTIANILGEVVLTETSSGNKFSINTSNLKSGVYFITVTNQGKQSTQKIIIE
ncbi:MAG: T9SS type A sorting domain-containing protein [Bacteroidia bacterium]|nr:T9SS type A sorting domain-containing protein [Bacteroidia bacterium]